MTKWRRHLYQPTSPLGKGGTLVTGSKEHVELSRKAATEGGVLLKNESSVLPLKNSKIVLVGKATIDYVKGGGGSGDVNCAYVKNLYEGFLEKEDKVKVFKPLVEFYENYVTDCYNNGAVPGLVEEPIVDDELLKAARDFSSVAVLSISRYSGEDWDRLALDKEEDYSKVDKFAKISSSLFGISDFYLTHNEKLLIERLSSLFNSIIVVLNTGGVVETKWIKTNERIKGALLALQGGMEGGCAVADLLCGDVTPSGKLTDTYADDIYSYPGVTSFHNSITEVEYNEDIFVGYRYFNTIPKKDASIVYPFGYGLSYTNFNISDIKIESALNYKFEVTFKIKNVGKYDGKEVVQIYSSAPQGLLGKPKYQLVGFKKTDLLKPNKEGLYKIKIDLTQGASYDDNGLIEKDSFVLEKGSYKLFIGSSLDSLTMIDYKYELSENKVVEKLHDCLSPTSLSKRLKADGEYEKLETRDKVKDINKFERQNYYEGEGLIPFEKTERQITRAEDIELEKIKLINCAIGNMSLKQFVKTLSDDELISLTGGQPNRGVANTYGFGNSSIHGIPNVMTADGPAGLRIDKQCGVNTTAWPCATLLASTWDLDLVEKVGVAAGLEVKENNIGVWLAPGVNIHRNPVCGRNFEYYSEDPYLSGKIGIAMVKGVQQNKVGACVKHFALNNKETNRKQSDSICSKRAIREIYLKVFEMIVKEAEPYTLMSSYNLINGERAAENKDLLSTILREEWNFEGLVFSDWWNHSEHYLEILAGQDIKMGCGFPSRVKEVFNKGYITRKDLEKTAIRILSVMLRLE